MDACQIKMAQALKSANFLSVRTPLFVTGTLSQPRYAPDPAPLAARGAAALVLGLINPLASLCALLETGPGREGTCTELGRATSDGRAASTRWPS
jgi:hypothetical protein